MGSSPINLAKLELGLRRILMKNGPYEMVIAPEEYPGRRYRNRYVYEHQLVWWKNTGKLVPKGLSYSS